MTDGKALGARIRRKTAPRGVIMAARVAEASTLGLLASDALPISVRCTSRTHLLHGRNRAHSAACEEGASRAADACNVTLFRFCVLLSQ